jgi:hypothetical protein
MAFLVRLGSLTIVTPTVFEAVKTYEKFEADGEPPIVLDMEGSLVDVERLRGILSDEIRSLPCSEEFS